MSKQDPVFASENPVSTFSFQAEHANDVLEYLSVLSDEGLPVERFTCTLENAPDAPFSIAVLVEIDSSAELVELVRAAHLVPDGGGGIIGMTLWQCPLSENSLSSPLAAPCGA
jgi:hypothetical protein